MTTKRKKYPAGKRAATRWLNSKILVPEVRDAIDTLRIVDTHEHLDEEATRLRQPNNLTRLFKFYAFDDVATAGLSPEAQQRFYDPEVSGQEQWKLIRSIWPFVRHTGYCQAIRLSIKELYGIDDLRDDTIEPLLERIARRNRPGVLRWILEDVCGIECCLVNAIDAPPGDLCRTTAHPGLFLFDLGVAPLCANDLKVEPYEKFSGIACHNLADWKRILDFYFTRWGGQVVAIKNQCAYWRTLKFDDVPESEAAPLFEKWLLRKEAVTGAERKAVQDFNFHYCIRRAIDLNLPVKIHTGYHAGQGYMDMSLFQPKDLANLFRQYPRARFDLFHIGYPEHLDVVALVKQYGNVWADLCWTWIIDPQASLQFVRHALSALPSNKMFGFGGDYGFADVAYGHSRIARDGIALALSEAVREGRLTRADAKAVARRWLRENAMEFYRIQEKRAVQASGQPAPSAEASLRA